MGIYTPPQKKSAQVNFFWGKNDVRTAIQHFYNPKNCYTPQNKLLATPLITGVANYEYLSIGRYAVVGCKLQVATLC